MPDAARKIAAGGQSRVADDVLEISPISSIEFSIQRRYAALNNAAVPT
jgi:hypothetical protein